LVHVLTFDSVIEALGPTEHGFERATPRLKTALKRALKSVAARGGTDLEGGITAAGAALDTIDDRNDADEYERVVLLITDGAYGDEATAARQRDIELGGARVIVVGIGQDMNGYLETLAANGMFAYVPAEHRTGDVSRTVCGRISQPAHRNARLVAPGLEDQAPHLTPDIYPGSTVTLWARMARPAAGSTVAVVTDSGDLADIPVRTCGDGSATSRWAKEHINSVDYDVMTGRTDEASGRERIVRVSIRHRVLSKYTAWLAVDTSRTTDTVIPKRIVQPTYSMDLTLDVLAAPMMRSVGWRSSMAVVSESSFPDMDQFFSDGVLQGHLGILVDLIDELVELLDQSDDMIDVDAVLDCVLRIAMALDRRGLHGLDRRTRDKIKRRAAKLTGRQRPADAGVIRIAREIADLHADGEGRSASTQP
ncbi:MAG: VWA domain-containing protein, partial [Actinomycetota bacterium]